MPTPEGFDLLPGNTDLTAAELEADGCAMAREQRLKRALEPVRERYDFILIDCPPALSLLTLNALTAADSVLVPMQCEYFALEGLTALLQTDQGAHGAGSIRSSRSKACCAPCTTCATTSPTQCRPS